MDFGCTVPLEDGTLCGEHNCTKHTRRVPVPSGSYYPEPVWRWLSAPDADAQLEQFDTEIALLRTIMDAIYSDSGGLSTKDRYELILKYAHEIIWAISRRDRMLAERELLVHRSLIKKLMYDVYLVLCRYIKDETIRNKIGADLNKIDLSGYRASNQLRSMR